MNTPKKYSPEVERIRNDLASELKKTLPASYNVVNSNWKVELTADGNVKSSAAAQEFGFYIGASIDLLSLSDLALLIDSVQN